MQTDVIILAAQMNEAMFNILIVLLLVKDLG